MSAHDFKTFVNNEYSLIRIIGFSPPLRDEFELQASDNPLLKISASSTEHPEYIFCLVDKNFSKTTESINKSLHESTRNKAKLYIVLRNLNSHHKQDVLNYIQKKELHKSNQPTILDFDKNHKDDEVVEILLKNIIHNYQRSSKKKHLFKTHKNPINIAFKILIFILALVILVVTQVVVRNAFLHCALNSLIDNKNPSPACFAGLRYTNKFIDHYSIIGNIFPWVDKKMNLNLEWYQVSLHLSESLGKYESANKIMGKIFYHLFNSDRPIDPNLLSKFEESLAASNTSLGFLQASLKEMYLTSEKQLSSIESLGEEVNRLQASTHQLQKVAKDLPILLSQSTPSTVLIVVQDNTELRPTGGFIDTVLIVSLDSGHISDIEVVDTFSLDQNLNGLVSPPEKYSELTGETKWYLRDSNWETDFPQAANQINWFLQKERGLSADLIIGINLNLFEKITSLVKVPKQGNFIQNYLDLAQLGEGSSSFILESTRNVIEVIKNFKESQFSNLSSILLKQLQNREIFIYPTSFSAPSLSQLGWDGSLFTQDCTNFNLCSKSGYIYFVDTNIGLNKSDAFTQKIRESQIVISDNKAVGNHTLKYANTSPKNTWPSGSHKNYLRIYHPDNLVIEEIIENGKELVAGEYEIKKVDNSNIIEVSLFVETPPQAESQIEIRTVSRFSDSEILEFSFYFPKQPGLKLAEQKLNISYPNTWLATTYSKPEFASSGVLGYNLGSLNSNRPETIKFIKKLHE